MVRSRTFRQSRREGDLSWKTKWENRCRRTVEVNGASVPVQWKLQPHLGKADAGHVVFVYEAAEPHLRLRWVWESRASSGAMEHYIEVENLSGKELWLPMIDSLRLAIHYASGTSLEHVYVEKGANTPSDHGTHTEVIADGYRWAGKSSTYALPQPGEPREIIPAEFVFDREGAQGGWYAGIEFSGRTRISLERNQAIAKHGSWPESRSRPVTAPRLTAGGSFKTPTVFLGVFAGGADGAATSCVRGCARCWAIRSTWKDPHYPSAGEQQLGQRDASRRDNSRCA